MAARQPLVISLQLRINSLCQSQTSQEMQAVGVNAEIRIVEFIHLAADFDGRANGETLKLLRESSDVNDWRNAARADLVHLITGGKGGIGDVNSYGAVTGYRSFNSYTFTHEVSQFSVASKDNTYASIYASFSLSVSFLLAFLFKIGHNLGCYHDRRNSETSHPFAHGFRVPGVLRTVMSYSSGCASCPRIPYFSADGYSLNDGAPIGDPSHNCALEIAQNAPTVAKWR